MSIIFGIILAKYLAENSRSIVVPPVEGVAGGGTAYGWNDEGSDPLRGSINPTEVPTGDLVHVWCLPSTVNVGPQEMPRLLEPVRIITYFFKYFISWLNFLAVISLHKNMCYEYFP